MYILARERTSRHQRFSANSNRARSRSTLNGPDIVFISAIAIIVAIGLIMLSSATSILSLDQTQGQHAYSFVWQQLLHGVLPGLILFGITYTIDYRLYKRWFLLFAVISLLLPLLPFIPSLGMVTNGVKGWIHVLGITLQTSELAKFTFIVWLAAYLSRNEQQLRSRFASLTPVMLVTGLLIIELILQPDTGMALLFISITILMVYSADTKFSYLLLMAAIGVSLMIPLLFSARYKIDRIISFLRPSQDIQGIGYQVRQALIALGSGSWFGRGIGQSQQKYKFVPEVQSDSIFAIIGEEWGFMLSSVLIALFAFVVYRGLRIARLAPDGFGKLLAVGVISMIASQVVINIGALLGLLPLTGLPLPFISLGGTNMAILLALVGILANISRHADV